MVHIIFKSEPICTNTVTLTNNQSVETSKKPSKGRWYYEFTHVAGTGYHLAGFKMGNFKIHTYPQGCSSCIKVWLNQHIIKENLTNGQNLGFTDVVNLHTIGLGFDTYSRVFTVYYENQIKRYTILSQSKETKVLPSIYEANDPRASFNDTISFNFGEKEFKYGLPYGYLPWGKSNKQYSCSCHKKTYSFNIFIVILMLITH